MWVSEGQTFSSREVCSRKHQSCPLHLSLAQGTGTWERLQPGPTAPPGAPGWSSSYTCSSFNIGRTCETQQMPDPWRVSCIPPLVS